jgi:large subunit ribosomal protein L29
MKLDEIRALSTEDLNAKVYELKQELLALRFQHATGQLENGKKITEIRKSIARIYTVIKERELGIASK